MEKYKTELNDIEVELNNETSWREHKLMQTLSKRKNIISKLINKYSTYLDNINDYKELYKLAELEKDINSMLDIKNELINLIRIGEKLKIEILLNEPHDSNNAYLEINAGAGGTESHDWNLMLMRAYLRWGQKNGYKTEIIDQLDGEEAGIKSVSIKFSGENAYGFLKSETGVHRLVRISPFNAAGKRQTSFCSIWVYPEIDNAIEIEILEKDLEIQTYRASGAGGQHVNKTDSAVRIVHVPSGIIVQCQNDRSQHRNKATAIAMLKSRLYEKELSQQKAEIDSKNATKTSNGWGSQIRSYVLQPYQMVKDLRTNAETSDVNGVLDGDFDLFMLAYLVDNC